MCECSDDTQTQTQPNKVGQHPTIQQLLGAFSSPRQITNQRQFYSWQPRHKYWHRPLLPPAPPPPRPSNPQHHMSSGTNAGTNHITTTMQPRPSHGGFPGKPRTLSLCPLLFSPTRNTYPAIPVPLGPVNQIAITTGPRPTHGGYSPPALHQPANHPQPQTNNSAYPRALKRGGRRRRTPPTTTTITGNTPTRTQTIKSEQLTLLNPSPRHQNYSTPPHHRHRGLPLGAATPPIPPYPWFPQQRWSRLEWARGIGSATATLRPPLCRDTVGLRRAATPHLAR